MLKKQQFYPKVSSSDHIPTIKSLALYRPPRELHRPWKAAGRAGVYQDPTFVLQACELYSAETQLTHIRQENYIKFNFWLAGKHTTVLNGFGQYEHERPEVFITAGPPEMIKMDWLAGRCSWVALCVLREFFPEHMKLDLESLPPRLRAIVLPDEVPFTVEAIALSADLMAAAQAVLAASSTVRQDPLYSQAKAIELMCLLISHLADEQPIPGIARASHHRRADRLHAARELLAKRYAEPLTLIEIAKEVGISKTALTVGFRNLFGESVFEYLQKQRMQRAYELLQSGEIAIERVAHAVGYPHACNFSTAFRAHFGYSPRLVVNH